MTIRVLRSSDEIRRARRELKRRGLSLAITRPQQVLRRLLGRQAWRIGDRLKSWDVLETARFIEANCAQGDPILDIGTYGSEIAPILSRMGYRRVAGVDLDPGLANMGQAAGLPYVRGNFMRMPFRPLSIKVVTAISVIEHGYQGASLFEQIAWALIDGGYFLASFDYWPEKVDTGDVRFFGMDWKIFSRDEVLQLVREAAAYRLVPVGRCDLEAQIPPIHFAGRRYTFAWMALRKEKAPTREELRRGRKTLLGEGIE